MMAKGGKKLLKIFLYILVIFFFFVTLFFLLFHYGFLSFLATIKFDKNKLTYLTSQVNVYTENQKPIQQKVQNAKTVSLENIPKHVIDAFISIEDKNFYKHNGINYKRIAKALIKNISTLKMKEGASTISQQLIKNTHLTNEKTIRRKINEVLLTQQLEKSMNKDDIITAYLNVIYFGSGAFGINNASQRFFSKDVSKLNLSESATLAGIIKSPKIYSPITEPERCIERRNLVLSEMYKDDKISKEEFVKFKNMPLNLNINKSFLGNNTYYSACIDEACEILKITEKDLILNQYKIITYMDENLQNIAEQELVNIDKYSDIKNVSNLDRLILIANNKTGGINAFNGKSDYNLLNLYRQPGSTLKPIISYAPAIEFNIINPLTPVLDEKININGYCPNNYNNKNYGWISAKQALAKSLNIPSVKILDYVGIDNAKKFAKNMGIDFSSDDNGHSLALGGMTKGIKFIDLLNCYQIFANNGQKIKLSFIKEIQTKEGLTIYKHNIQSNQTIRSSTAFLISDMLKESVLTGTSKRLKIDNVEICAKTGTVGCTNSAYKENTDAWNLSYTPDISMCVWVGSTNKTNLLNKKITGGSIPTQIAQSIYSKNKFKNKKFTIPNDVKICEINDFEYINDNKINLCSNNTPERYRRKEYFSLSNQPKTESTMFIDIDKPQISLNECNRSKIEIKLNAKKHLAYNLYKYLDGTRIHVASTSNKQGQTILTDKNVISNKVVKYYVEAKINNCNKEKDINGIENFYCKSNEIDLYVA